MPRSVLVTGGAHRLGSQICETFALAGWRVWCHYHQSAEAAERLQARMAAQGAIVQPIQADLHDELQRRDMMARIQSESGPLAALVNNASSFEPDSALAPDVNGARAQWEVNLLAPLALSGLFAQQGSCAAESRSEDRCIIHILDQKVFNLNPDYFSYTVTKLALERSVALQAQALAPGVRVCGVAPGLMFVSGPQTLENFEIARCVNLLRRPIDPAQVADSCLFLAQNDAITGVTLTVDNGQHLVPLERDVMFVADALTKGEDVL